MNMGYEKSGWMVTEKESSQAYGPKPTVQQY